VARADRDRQVDEMLHLVRLEPWADKRPHELSGGMQQRVGLARALATDAEILLMDEPFSALDPLIREHLQDELLDLQRSLHKTIVFVSHDLDESLKLGSRIAIM
jgi:glycine betaine/proline transport system ATP-binding protein